MRRDGPEANPHRIDVETFFIRELIPHTPDSRPPASDSFP